jgi:hypothetical protein
MRNVHQLMAESFLGPRADGYEIDHIDGIKTHNLLTNIEYVPKRENLRRRDDLGLGHRGERTGNAVLKNENIPEILQLRSDGWSYARIASRLGVSVVTVFNVVKGKTWSHVSGSITISL